MISRSQRRPSLCETDSVQDVRKHNEAEEMSSHLHLTTKLTEYYSADEGKSALWDAFGRDETTHRRSHSDEVDSLRGEFGPVTPLQIPRSLRARGSGVHRSELTPRSSSAQHTATATHRSPGYKKPLPSMLMEQRTHLYTTKKNVDRPKTRGRFVADVGKPKPYARVDCRNCGAIFRSSTELKQHSCHVTIVRCPYFPQCMFHTIDRFDLRDHVFAFHHNKPFFKCEKCDKSFDVARELCDHFRESKEHLEFENDWKDWMTAHPQYNYRSLDLC